MTVQALLGLIHSLRGERREASTDRRRARTRGERNDDNECGSQGEQMGAGLEPFGQEFVSPPCHDESIPENSSRKTKHRFAVKSRLCGAHLPGRIHSLSVVTGETLRSLSPMRPLDRMAPPGTAPPRVIC